MLLFRGLNVSRHGKRFYVPTALLVLGLLLRLPLLANGLWGDEGFTYYDVSAPTLREMFSRITLSETNPPLFFLLLRFWTHLIGFSEIALKTFPLLWSTASLFATYWLARACASRLTALTALFFIATSYEAIVFSTEVRPYAMEQFFATMCVLFYVRAIFKGSIRSLAMWVVCAILLILTQYTGLLLMGALIVATILFRKAVVVNAKRIIFAYVLVASAFPFWIPTFMHHMQAGTPWFTKLLLPERVGVFFDTISLFMPMAPFPLEIIGRLPNNAVATFLVLTGSLGIILEYYRACRRQEKPDASFPFLLCVFFVAMFEMSATGYLPNRYFMPFASIIMAAYAEIFVRLLLFMRNSLERHAALRRQWIQRLLTPLALGYVLLVLIFSVVESNNVLKNPKSGFRALAAQASLPAHDARVLWLVAPDYSASILGYYFRDIPDFQMRLHGFVRWESPEILQVSGYSALWEDNHALEIVLERIAASACEKFDTLAFVKPMLLYQHPVDQGLMQYGKARHLEEALRRRYSILQTRLYEGHNEHASLILFHLHCNHLLVENASPLSQW